MNIARLLLAALALCAAQIAHAQPTPLPDNDADTAQQKKAQALLDSLKPQHGTIKLPKDIATLQLSDDFYYLAPSDAGRLLSEGWGNPPDITTLGMILPAKLSPLSRAGWGVVVTYNDDGHVSDDDNAKIDYSELLKQMQDEDAKDNEERKKQGYSGLHLLGWAEPPHYDQAAHKLYWAKELKADDASENTLNYSIRVLGRQGVLELNAVAAMSDLANIKQEMPKILAFTNFSEGNRYTDFVNTDKVAGYGLAALVAGGIAAKAGLFAKLFTLLLAAKKLLVVAALAVVGFVRKLFGMKPKNKAPPPDGGPRL